MKDNWYLVLELEFDPNPVHDPAIIEEAITAKSNYWSRNANHYVHGPAYRAYRERVPEIRETMAKAKERKRLAKEACQLVYGPIDALMNLVASKGGVTQAELHKIAKDQKVDLSVVERRREALGMQIIEDSSPDYKGIYKKYVKSKPRSAATFDSYSQMLATFNVDNFYDFLFYDDIENGTNKATTKDLAKLPLGVLKQKAILVKEANYHKLDSISANGAKICSRCILTFADDGGKAKYDEYLEYRRRQTVFEDVRRVAGITGEVSASQFDIFLEKLADILSDSKTARHVLEALLITERIPFSQNHIKAASKPIAERSIENEDMHTAAEKSSERKSTASPTEQEQGKIVKLCLARRSLGKYHQCIVCRYDYHDGDCTVMLRKDGTVAVAGWSSRGKCNVTSWRDIIAVAMDEHRTYGLKDNGTVVATKHKLTGNKKPDIFGWEDMGWQDVGSIACGDNVIVGIRTDGTVVKKGYIGSGLGGAKDAAEYDVAEGGCDLSVWRDIISVAVGYDHIVGLKADGAVVASGDNQHGECDVSDWHDVKAVGAANIFVGKAVYSNTVGLKADGTVVVAGSNVYGQCNVGHWEDIVSVVLSGGRTVGLKSDGTVVAVGNSEHGRCDVEGWEDIVSIACSARSTHGLKADGTVVTTSDRVLAPEYGWREIVAIFSWEGTIFGLRADGTVIATHAGYYKDYQDSKLKKKTNIDFTTPEWRNIGPPNANSLLMKKREDENMVATWLQHGLCRHCGGEIGGLFTKKCKTCDTPQG